MTALRVPAAFLLRDLRVELSYKSGLLLKVCAGLMSVALFYFVARVIRNVSPTAFAEYGGYFSYVIVGLALVAYMTRGIGAMASGMRDAQGSGSLEIMVLTPTRLPTLLVAMAFPAYVLGLITLVAYLAAGAVLGADFGNANVPAALVSLVVIVPSFIALSLFAAALVFVTRRGNPVAWALRAASTLLGGVLYPVSASPAGCSLSRRRFRLHMP